MFNTYYRGILLASGIGILSFLVAPYVPILNEVLFAFGLGVIIGNFVRLPEIFSKGISFASSKFLEFSIVLLAFSISFTKIAQVGLSSFVLIAVMIVVLLLLTIFLAKRLSCPTSAAWLVGFGTAICGSAAIAALAPKISKNKEDAGVSVAIVNLIGSLGMVVIPLVLAFLQVSDLNSGIFLGASLHSVGNVAGAGYGMNSVIGDTALTIKLARVALLSPAIIFFNFLVHREEKKSMASLFHLPPYLWAFIAITIFVSVVPLPDALLKFLKEAGTILLTIAMAAIGLKVSFKQLLQSGKRALNFGLLIFFLQLLLVAGFMQLL